jgi:hypothetical protein
MLHENGTCRRGGFAGGADVPFFGMSATADSEGRIHADKRRRHVCATREHNIYDVLIR